MPDIQRDEISGTETTGHEWDGIQELNTPLPRWWLWTFYATVIWGLGYTIAYPAWPMISGATTGVLGWNSRTQIALEQANAKAAQASMVSRIEAASLDEITKDADLLQFAKAGGAAAFKVNCVQCHGSGAAGAPGYPNLNDDDWIWGGSLEAIQTTLLHGIRYAQNPNTRDSQMPRFGVDGILTPVQIVQVTEHVLAISGQEADAAAAQAGSVIFAENCAACHGASGEGNRDLGSPALADAIWLYGSDRVAIAQQITDPTMGVMPAWSPRLDATSVKQLAVYVHSLGGGEPTP
jgi:cytochrome c oxidase cbb3-type subunit 3